MRSDIPKKSVCLHVLIELIMCFLLVVVYTSCYVVFLVC